MLPQIVVKHVMDERATFRCGTQVDPRILFDSSSFISRSYFDDSMGSLHPKLVSTTKKKRRRSMR